MSITTTRPARRDPRGTLRRQKLIEAARILFVERGYRGTTLRDIIARAGGSYEMITTGFGGKIGLLAAIVCEAEQDVARLILDPAWIALPAREGLTRLALRLIEIWRSPEGRAVHRMVASEGAESPEILKAWYQNGAEPSEAALARYLAIKHGHSELAIADPAAVARQFHLLVLGAWAMPVIAGEEQHFDAPTAVAEIVDLLLRAYGSRAPADPDG